jgi:hypothetical protein
MVSSDRDTLEVTRRLTAAFRTAERTPNSWLFECRLPMSRLDCFALAENGSKPPLVTDAALEFKVCIGLCAVGRCAINL